MDLSQKELNERFEYRDGQLFYKTSPLPKIKVGSKAGTLDKTGYIKLSIDNKKEAAHRIIFMMHHGYLPEEIDHINCNRADNRIENLRAATRKENRRNVVAYKNNTSGTKGVSWKAAIKKWQVCVSVDGVKKYLGVFKDFELADLVAAEARDKYHGVYANHGIGA